MTEAATEAAKRAMEAHAQRFISSVWGWPSGWNIYWILFFSAALTLLLPLLLRSLSRSFRNREAQRVPLEHTTEKLASAIQKQKTREEETFVGRKILIRSLTSVTLALFFFSLIVVLGPLVGLLKPEAGAVIVIRTFFCILSVSLLGLVAVVYATRKGNTWWTSSRTVNSGTEKPNYKGAP